MTKYLLYEEWRILERVRYSHFQRFVHLLILYLPIVHTVCQIAFYNVHVHVSSCSQEYLHLQYTLYVEWWGIHIQYVDVQFPGLTLQE